MIELIPSSFRDPSGFVFLHDGEIYRQVNASYRDHYDLLMSSGLYENLVKQDRLIAHTETQNKFGSSKDAYKILAPQRLELISYPYEWCFSQYQLAALLVLEIQKQALAHGMTLKDASAYNVQFRGTQPVWIDTLSFEKYSEGSPWVAYRQFCQHFLAPLALMSSVDLRFVHLMKSYIDGLPLDLASQMLPWTSWLKPSLLIHLHLHSRAQRRFADSERQGGEFKETM